MNRLRFIYTYIHINIYIYIYIERERERDDGMGVLVVIWVKKLKAQKKTPLFLIGKQFFHALIYRIIFKNSGNN